MPFAIVFLYKNCYNNIVCIQAFKLEIYLLLCLLEIIWRKFMLYRHEYTNIATLAANIRILALQAICSVGSGHVGGSMSIADTLAVLYGKVLDASAATKKNSKRSQLVVSKGHCGPAVYAALALNDYFPAQNLVTMNRPLTTLPSHCDRLKTPGVDMTTGSLGQGASAACGIALANKIKKNFGVKTYLILGDGECNEGQVWEAAQFIANQDLHNLITIVDWNKKQLDGYTKDVSGECNFEDKFKAFGFNAVTIDGHDLHEIFDALTMAQNQVEKPSVIILDTVKGKGFKKAEETESNHSMAITEEDFKQAVKEIQDNLKKQLEF